VAEKTKILIVDNDKESSESLTDVLEIKGYEVEAVNSAASSIAKIKEKYFDVVIMDIAMPVMNGVETFKQIKKIRPASAVIMVTAFSVEDLIKEALKEGAFGYNGLTDEFADLFKDGVVDPVLVTKHALINAASISSMLITIAAMITDKPEAKAQAAPMDPSMMGGMGGMGGMPGMGMGGMPGMM